MHGLVSRLTTSKNIDEISKTIHTPMYQKRCNKLLFYATSKSVWPHCAVQVALFPEKPDVPSWPSPSTYFLPPPNCAPTPMTNFIPTRIFGLIPFRICCNTFKEGRCFRFWELPRNSVRKLFSMSYNVSRGGLKRKAISMMYRYVAQ